MRESARIYDVRMAQFVLRIEKLSHIIGARESRDLRSPSPIMAPGATLFDFNICTWQKKIQAIKLEVNDLRENLPLDVQNLSKKLQTCRLALVGSRDP